MLRASGPCAVGHVGKARRRTRRPRHHRGLAGSVGQPRRRDLLEISGTLSRWSSVLLRASSTTSAGGIAASTDVAARPQARPAVAVRAASLLCLRIEGAVAPAVQAKRAINKGRGALKPVRFAGKSQLWQPSCSRASFSVRVSRDGLRRRATREHCCTLFDEFGRERPPMRQLCVKKPDLTQTAALNPRVLDSSRSIVD